jgi:hypothetical protein
MCLSPQLQPPKVCWFLCYVKPYLGVVANALTLDTNNRIIAQLEEDITSTNAKTGDLRFYAAL